MAWWPIRSASAIVMTFRTKPLALQVASLGWPIIESCWPTRFFGVVFNTAIYTGFGVGIKFSGLVWHWCSIKSAGSITCFALSCSFPGLPTVISALNWRWIYDDASGLINNVLVRLELVDETISWLSDPHLAMLAVIVVVVWQGTPFSMSFLAGLQAIPKELYEQRKLMGRLCRSSFFHHAAAFAAHLHHRDHAVGDLDLSKHPVCVHLDQRWASRSHPDLPTMAYNLALGGAQRLGMGATVSLFFFPILVVFIIFLTRRMLREKGE